MMEQRVYELTEEGLTNLRSHESTESRNKKRIKTL